MEWVIVFGEFHHPETHRMKEMYCKMSKFTYDNNYQHNEDYRLVFEGTSDSCDNILHTLTDYDHTKTAEGTVDEDTDWTRYYNTNKQH